MEGAFRFQAGPGALPVSSPKNFWLATPQRSFELAAPGEHRRVNETKHRERPTHVDRDIAATKKIKREQRTCVHVRVSEKKFSRVRVEKP